MELQLFSWLLTLKKPTFLPSPASSTSIVSKAVKLLHFTLFLSRLKNFKTGMPASLHIIFFFSQPAQHRKLIKWGGFNWGLFFLHRAPTQTRRSSVRVALCAGKGVFFGTARPEPHSPPRAPSFLGALEACRRLLTLARAGRAFVSNDRPDPQ